MFEQDTRFFSIGGLAGLRVEVGYSILLLMALYASLSQGMNPQAMSMFAIMIISALLAAHVQAAFATLQGIQIERICLGGAGTDLLRHRDEPGRDEFMIAMALPLTHLGLFALFGLAANVAANQAGLVAADGGAPEAYATWRHIVEGFWLAATVNFFLGALHLMPAYPLAGGMLFHQTLRQVLPEEQANVAMGFVGAMTFVLWIPLCLGLLAVGQGVFLSAPGWHRHMALMNNQTQY